MDTNSESENTQNHIEEEKNLFVVHNLVPEIEASVNGAPLSPLPSAILNGFEKNQGGVIRVSNLPLVAYSEELEEKINRNSKEYISVVQKLNPEVSLENIPLYLLSSSVNRDACALKGKGVAINTRYLQVRNKSDEYISNTVIHEATHIFINRLGKEPEFFKGDFKRNISNFLWFEGLAQYMEPYPGKISKMFKEYADKWPEILNTWFKTDSEQEKGNILDSILNMESIKKILTYRHGKEKDEKIGVLLNSSSKDEALQALIVQEGFGYYIGKTLWEQEIGKGKDLKELVMKGSLDIDNWIN